MSPKPVDDGLDDEVQPSPPPKKRVAVAAPDGPVMEVSLPEETLRPDMPIVRARVIYLGPGEHHAISFTGQIHEQWIEDPEEGTVTRKDRAGTPRRYTVLKAAVPTGITQYDFTCRDTRGHMIPSRLMPDGTKFAGRAFSWCEHVGHLRNFFLALDERGQKIYHLMVRPEHMALLQEHIRRSERARRASAQLFAEVVKG